MEILWVATGAFAMLLGLFLNMWKTARSIKRLFIDDVSVSCPLNTSSHEQLMFGSYTPTASRVLRIYVHPHDGTNNYFIQIPRTEPGGSWSYPVRLGNPYWRNMTGASPLTYDVFVALSKPNATLSGSETTLLQIPDGIDFARKLLDEGATAVKHVTISRHAENIGNFIPRIVQPVVPTDPRENAITHGAFVLKWEPARPMWVELWQNGHEVPNYPECSRDSGTCFNLEPGLYEIKVKEFKKSQFHASLWIEVVKSL